jgi:hypothetical protein
MMIPPTILLILTLPALAGTAQVGYAPSGGAVLEPGVPSWVLQTPASSPPPGNGPTVFDAADGYVLLYQTVVYAPHANPCDLRTIWSYSDHLWKELSSASAPAFNTASLAYDAQDGYVVLFGGCGTHSNQTWTFRAGTWTNQTAAVAPPAREGGALAYDPSSKSVLVFGGYVYRDPSTGAGYRSNDSWLYPHGTWRNVSTLMAPPARDLYSISTDSLDDSVVLFGGSGAGEPTDTGGSCCPLLADSWRFSGELWSNISSGAGPSARTLAALAEDPESHSVILFGGEGPTDHGSALPVLDDTWSLSSGSWQRLPIDGHPPGRMGGDLVYDPLDGGLVLFGGQAGGTTSLNDTWVLTDAAPATPPASAAPAVADWVIVGAGTILVAAVVLVAILRPRLR